MAAKVDFQGPSIPSSPDQKIGNSSNSLPSEEKGTAEKIRRFVEEYCPMAIVFVSGGGLGILIYGLVNRVSVEYPFYACVIAAVVLSILNFLLAEDSKDDFWGFTQSPSFIQGQPPGFKNEINTCFANAALQALFACYRQPLRETAQKELAYHKAWMKLNEIISDREGKKEWALNPDEIKGILIMLARQKKRVVFPTRLEGKALSKVEGILPQFIEAYKKELPWPEVPDFSVEELKEMVAIFRKDPAIFETMFPEQDEKHLKAFQTLSDLIEDYTRRETLLRGNVKDLSLENADQSSKIEVSCLRAFLPSGGSYSQEDTEELITALFKWIRGCEYPDAIPVCKQKRYKAPYEIPAEPFQDDKRAEIIPEAVRKQIDTEFAKLKTKTDAQNKLEPFPLEGCEEILPDPFIRVVCPFEAGANGQELIDDWFQMKSLQELTEFDKYKSLCYYEEGAYYVFKEKNDLSELPEHLMIELKRHRFRPGQISGEKIHTEVPFSEQLLIKGQQYRLQAMILQTGGALGGHYKAYLWSQEKWWECDDRRVSIVTPEALPKVLSRGYLYFLQKIKTDGEIT